VKVCLRCEQQLPLDAFRLTRQGNPGSWCKPCYRDYKSAWKKSPRGRESEREERARNAAKRQERWKTRHPERNTEMNRKAGRKYYDGNKAKILEYRRRFHREHPEVQRACQLVRAMVFFGLLVPRLCEACGNRKAQAHHPDHWKPLAIVWLCSRCHARLGMTLRDPANLFVPRDAGYGHETKRPNPDDANAEPQPPEVDAVATSTDREC
jgi:hypothetical protein